MEAGVVTSKAAIFDTNKNGRALKKGKAEQELQRRHGDWGSMSDITSHGGLVPGVLASGTKAVNHGRLFFFCGAAGLDGIHSLSPFFFLCTFTADWSFVRPPVPQNGDPEEGMCSFSLIYLVSICTDCFKARKRSFG
jgi:hypothetical protein